MLPSLGAAVWAYRGYRIARVIRAVDAGREISATRYITRAAAKRLVGRPVQRTRGHWTGQRFYRYRNPNTGRQWRSPVYKKNNGYLGYYSNFNYGKRGNIHVKHHRWW